MGMVTRAAEQAAKAQDKLAKVQAPEQKKAAGEGAKLAKVQADVAKANAAIDFKPAGVFSEALGKMGPKAQAAAFAVTLWATAIIGAGAAITATMSKIIALVQGMTLLQSRFQALARGGPAAGNATLESLKRLSKFLPFSESQVTEWGQALMMAKLRGRGRGGQPSRPWLLRRRSWARAAPRARRRSSRRSRAAASKRRRSCRRSRWGWARRKKSSRRWAFACPTSRRRSG